MEVILKKNVDNLGYTNDLVSVKNGYGRNFLIPQGKAVQATKENVEIFEAKRAELEAKAAEVLAAAQARADKLSGMTVEMASKAGDEGKLFGSITAANIAEAVTAAGAELSKSEVVLSDGPLRNIGTFEITVQVHPDVNGTIKVKVIPE